MAKPISEQKLKAIEAVVSAHPEGITIQGYVMLACLDDALDPEVRPAPSELLVSLKELQAARRALIKDRTWTPNPA